MSTLQDHLTRDPIRAAVWGVSGSAKTTLLGMAAQFEELYPMYIADFDRRVSSLRARIPKEYWDRIHTDSYDDKGVQGNAWTTWEAKIQRLESEGYKTVCMDSMTFALDAAMARVLMLDGNKPATMNPQLQHYLTQQSMVKDILVRLCSKKFNFLCTFHEGTDKDEISGRLFKAFAVTGKLAERVPGYFNEIWHCEVVVDVEGGSAYRVRTRSDMTYAARTTFKTLKTVEFQDQIWPKVLAEIKAEKVTT